MIRIIKLSIFTCLSIVCVACTGVHNKLGTMADVDMREWSIIGIIKPEFKRREYELPVFDQNSTYNRFRIVSYNWAVNIDKVRVTFDGGEVWKPKTKYVYFANSASNIIAIPKAPRKIVKINVQIENKSGMGQPIVYFWGGK